MSRDRHAVGSVIASDEQAWIKRAANHHHTTPKWIPGNWDDDAMDRALNSGATVLRVGDGTEQS